MRFVATLLKRNHIFFTNLQEQKLPQFLATADGNIRESTLIPRISLTLEMCTNSSVFKSRIIIHTLLFVGQSA